MVDTNYISFQPNFSKEERKVSNEKDLKTKNTFDIITSLWHNLVEVNKNAKSKNTGPVRKRRI